MSRQPLPEQRGPGFLRRASASREELSVRPQGIISRATATRQRIAEDEEDDDAVYQTRPPSSARKYLQPKAYEIEMTDGSFLHVTAHELSTMPEDYQRAAPASKIRRQPNPKRPVQDDSVIEVGPARTKARETDGLPRQRRRLPRFHWMFYVGLSLFIMILGWIPFNAFANWWQITQDDIHYGRPRTFQIDAVVGHNDSPTNPSHFLAENLNRHIIVIEIPGGDTSKTKIYLGPTLYGPGQDLTPVTISFQDVNHDGYLDLVLHVEDTQFFLLNQKVKGVWQFVATSNQQQ